jgi:hypothetical protein
MTNKTNLLRCLGMIMLLLTASFYHFTQTTLSHGNGERCDGVSLLKERPFR